MLQKILSLLLAVLLFGAGGARLAAANTKEEKQAAFAAKVKSGINKLGTGEQARVELKLRDKTKLKSYISEAAEDSFVVIDANTGESSRVAYSTVKQVKGNNLNSGVKIAIIAAVVIAATLIFLAIGFAGGTDH